MNLKTLILLFFLYGNYAQTISLNENFIEDYLRIKQITSNSYLENHSFTIRPINLEDSFNDFFIKQNYFSNSEKKNKYKNITN